MSRCRSKDLATRLRCTGISGHAGKHGANKANGPTGNIPVEWGPPPCALCGQALTARSVIGHDGRLYHLKCNTRISSVADV